MYKSRVMGFEHNYHIGSSISCSLIFQSGLIATGKNCKPGRETVFFTAVDLVSEPQKRHTVRRDLSNKVESVPECSFFDVSAN